MSKAFQLSIFIFNFWQLDVIYHIYYKPTIQKKKKKRGEEKAERITLLTFPIQT